MNPYEPPISEPAMRSPDVHFPISLRHWMTFVAVATVKVACFGAFIFFMLIHILGVGVNWPNVIPLLGVAMLMLAIAHATQIRLLHDKFIAWRHSPFAYLVGVFVGVIAAACARAGLI